MAKPYYRVAKYDCQRSLGYLIRRVGNLMQPCAEALFTDEALTFTQWITLMGLRDGLAHTTTELAHHLNHDPGATTRLVDQLETRGLVVRTRSRTDRRVVELALSPEGRAMAKAMTPRVVALWNGILTDFSHAEIDRLIATLGALAAKLEQAQSETQERVREARVAS
jgi:DNA-binding MarR family transcriptional regulator